MQGTPGSTTFSTIFFRGRRLQAKNESVLLEQSSAITSCRQRFDLDGWWLSVRMRERRDGRRARSGKFRPARAKLSCEEAAREQSEVGRAGSLFCSRTNRHDERLSAWHECDCSDLQKQHLHARAGSGSSSCFTEFRETDPSH